MRGGSRIQRLIQSFKQRRQDLNQFRDILQVYSIIWFQLKTVGVLLRITIEHRRNGQSMPSFLLFQSFRMLLLFREVYQGERSQVTSSQCLYLISKRGAFLYPRHFFYKRPIRSRIKLQPQHPKVLQISVAFQSFSENPDSKHAFRDAKKILSN